MQGKMLQKAVVEEDTRVVRDNQGGAEPLSSSCSAGEAELKRSNAGNREPGRVELSGLRSRSEIVGSRVSTTETGAWWQGVAAGQGGGDGARGRALRVGAFSVSAWAPGHRGWRRQHRHTFFLLRSLHVNMQEDLLRSFRPQHRKVYCKSRRDEITLYASEKRQLSRRA